MKINKKVLFIGLLCFHILCERARERPVKQRL